MANEMANLPGHPAEPSSGDRLNSWKEIAAHLKCSERTVRRWEEEGLPVHRHSHKSKAAIYAYKAEIDAWWRNGNERLEQQGHVQHLPSGTRIEAIAVLPLQSLSQDPEQEYFADGMTDELITHLSRVGTLRVISRTSAMQYKGVHRPVRDIAQRLGVDAVIEGTVLRSDNRVRITAQLIDARTDRHLWAERFESDLRDILALQNEVARKITEGIRIKLTPEQQVRFESPGRVSTEAYDAYIKGRYKWKMDTNQGLEESVKYLEEATAKDPDYAPAFAALADAYLLGDYLLTKGYPHAKEAAIKALELDESLAEAHATLGRVRMYYDYDFSGAEKEFLRAVELDSNAAEVHHFYSHYLTTVGRMDESLAESHRALELDPLNVRLTEHLAWAYFYARQYDQAIAHWQKAQEMQPDFSGLYRLGWGYEQKGMFQEAAAVFAKRKDLPGLGHLYAVWGRKEEALKIAQDLESRPRPATYEIALIYAGLGDQDQAFIWLERAFREKSSFNLMTIKVEPRLDVLRTDARFADLVRRVGIPH